MTFPAHIEARINRDSECWLFTGPIRPDGYARVSVSKYKMQYLHILYWTIVNGPVPQGMTLDHYWCRNRSCCNPDHMEVVTRRENIQRGEVGKNSYSKTHCLRGHPFDEANTYRHNGKRHCRACACERGRRARRSRRMVGPVVDLPN